MTCPCGSGAELDACCGPYLEGATPAPTAEALMRSRYAAFATEAIDYIMATHHPAKRSEVDEEDIARWSKESEWLGLEVLGTEAGGEEDEEGEVEFVARFRDRNGRERNHRERAQFKRLDGAWYFFDGSPATTTPARRDGAKVGRNDPCPCGSGKKYKKCHGRRGS